MTSRIVEPFRGEPEPELFPPNDLVKRLRHQGADAFNKHYSLGMWKLCADAADRIEALERPAVALRPAIETILAEEVNFVSERRAGWQTGMTAISYGNSVERLIALLGR